MGSSLFPNYTLEKKPYLELKYWKIFKGINKSTGESISAFIFEKKLLDKKTEKEKDNILLCLRKEAETLIRGKNKHKNFLTVIESLKEDNYSLGFITEYITYNLISWIDNYHPSILEIKYIIYQLLSVINFIHSEYHISHNNINPENIFIKENNFIKITGFMFTTSLIKDTNPNGNSNNNLIYSKNVVEAFLDLKYLCPELIVDNEISNNSDNFVIGLISYYLLGEKNNNKDLLFLNDNSYDSYKNTYKSTNIDKKINSISNNDELTKDFLKSLLQNNSEKRKNLAQMQNSKFFVDSEDNNKLVPLCLLSKMESGEIANNYDLLKLLSNINVLNLFSTKEKEFLILPNLLYYLKIESLINPIVPCLFLIAEKSNNQKIFEEKIWPSYKKLFNMKKFPAATLYFTLKKLTFLINNLEKTEFNAHCIPLICKALDCGVLKIQEVILEELPNILKTLDKNEFQDKIYNRLVKIVIQTKNKQLRKKIMNFFVCLTDYFDSYFINNNFLDDIEKIIKNETTLNICKNAFILYEKIKLKVNDKSVRSKIIPSLLLMMCNGEISEDLFTQGENTIHSYIQKIKEKRKEQFVQDIESDSEEKNKNKDNNEKNKSSKNNSSYDNNGNNNIMASSPLSVNRTKSTLSGNISLFEINSSEDSNFALDEKNKNIKGKKGKNEKSKKKAKTKIEKNENNNLLDTLLNGDNEEIYNKNADSSFDSTSLGNNKKEINLNLINKKEFLSSLELKKVEKKKKLENNNTNGKKSNFAENKKNKWEEIESDDENTDELAQYIKPKKSKEEIIENQVVNSSKKTDKKNKWDEDDDEDDYEDANNELIINKKIEVESELSKNDSTKKENNIYKGDVNKLDELLFFNNEDDNKDKNNDINPINLDYNKNESKEKEKEKEKEEDKEKEEKNKEKDKEKVGSNKKKGVKKKKKHKKKDKNETKELELKISEIIDGKEMKNTNDENKEKGKENKELDLNENKKETNNDKKEKEENNSNNKNTYERQISTTKMRMNQRAAAIDLDNLLADDD